MTPSSCRWCAIPEREHAQRWKPPADWHPFVPPTSAQILSRMRARRAARIAQNKTPRGNQ